MREYDPRIERYLDEIAETPTGRPLVAWVRQHWPPITFGTPISGSAFTYPWPLRKIVLKESANDEWLREALAHELAHMTRWHGHLVASLEQEYDAYRIAAQVRCEHAGCDWRDPHGQAGKWYPDLFGPGATRESFMESLRNRDPFYAVLPQKQPRTWPEKLKAMARQGAFGVRQFLKGRKAAHSHDNDHG